MNERPARVGELERDVADDLEKSRRRQVCAWCGRVVDPGTSEQVTHVMCRSCASVRGRGSADG